MNFSYFRWLLEVFYFSSLFLVRSLVVSLFIFFCVFEIMCMFYRLKPESLWSIMEEWFETPFCKHIKSITSWFQFFLYITFPLLVPTLGWKKAKIKKIKYVDNVTLKYRFYFLLARSDPINCVAVSPYYVKQKRYSIIRNLWLFLFRFWFDSNGNLHKIIIISLRIDYFQYVLLSLRYEY